MRADEGVRLQPTDENECPVCQDANGTLCQGFRTRGDRDGYDCPRCGRYEISRTARIDWFGSSHRGLTALQRAVLSHRLRVASRSGDQIIIKSDWIDHFVESARLPSAGEQLANLIRRIGDHVSETGDGFPCDSATEVAVIGAFNREMFHQLCRDASEAGLVRSHGETSLGSVPGRGILSVPVYGLTLQGWDHYEAERKGAFSGHYGFLAMKFGDADLDALAKDSIKPAIKRGMGHDLVDLRDVPRAGIIDNIMRQQIRDAAFVLVDLTHDNSGAYWEAGYAEGLGKPVIYLCERAKFESSKTHFDTNHCTTVIWDTGDVERFEEELIATLRRSLNLF